MQYVVKYPTNRGIVYTVIRTEAMENSDPVVLDSFRTYERAEERLGQYEQQFKEASILNLFTFQIQTSSYYDE